MLRLPDTGETMSYTATFGEDNDYNFNIPFFTDNGNGTVTDTVTGLMWQKIDGGEMTITKALLYADTLTLGGYTDWRLPNAHEGFSILNHQFANPSLNTSVFPVTGAEYWWSSDRQANDTTKIWATNAGGGIGNHPKAETVSAGGTKKFHARAVRDINTPITLPNHFTDNGNSTITDNLTNLIWQKVPYSDTLTWEQALTYADTLSLSGASDWRLPNIKELQSINDEKLINPSLNKNFFSVTNAKKYWASTTLPNQTTKAWYLSTQFGITTYDFKVRKHELICVRGNAANTTAIAAATENVPIIAYPNPFSSKIKLTNAPENAVFSLLNSMGQVIYAGKEIEKQDFSTLPKGVYWLRGEGNLKGGMKIVKE